MKTNDISKIPREELEKRYFELLSNSNFGFNIPNIVEDAELTSNTKYEILSENKDLSLDLKSDLNHLIIEGENYSALSILNQYGNDYIDIIYIDPPYSANQHYLGYNNSFEHSDWLVFMRNRLSLAQSLLSVDGVIFISIDDGKYAYLKVLCDQVFGQKCYVGTIVWDKKTPHPNASDIEPLHEYILVYKKTDTVKRILINKTIRDASLLYEPDGRAYFLTPTMDVGAFGLNERPNMGYRIYYNPITKEIVVDNDYDHELARTSNDEVEIYGPERQDLIDNGFIIVRPTKFAGRLGCWSKGYENFVECQHRLVLIQNNAGNYEFYLKNYVNSPKDLIKDEPLKSIVKFPSQEGTRSLLKIFNNVAKFKYPKNVDLLKYLIGSYYRNDALVLDFFAGSGSTGQAVLELNKSDNGTRRVILCSNNENNSCLDCCLPRMKTLITGIRTDKTIYSTDKLSGNIIYTKIDYLNNFDENKHKETFNMIDKIRKEK